MKAKPFSGFAVLAALLGGILASTASQAGCPNPSPDTRPRACAQSLKCAGPCARVKNQVAANVAAVAADLAKLNKMRADAQKNRANVIVLGKATKLSETPSACINQAIIHFDLVDKFARAQPGDRMKQVAAAARRGKAAMEARRLDDANAALAALKALNAHK